MSDLLTSPTVTYYTSQGVITDPREYRSLFKDLPAEIPRLCQVIQGLLIHPYTAHLYGEKISHIRRLDLHLRSVPRMLRRIQQIDRRPLSEPRSPDLRLVGNCRDAATLFCSMLREQGIPVRVRVGFAAYFGYDDHWICEYWDTARQRWILIDPQLDEILIHACHITFDPHDLPHEQFVLAGRAWQMCRAKEVDSRRFGFRRWRGSRFVASSLLRDLATLNKVEMLAWDLHEDTPSIKALLGQTRENLDYLDTLADLTLGGDARFPQVRAAFEQAVAVQREIEILLKKEQDESDEKHEARAGARSGAYVEALLTPPEPQAWSTRARRGLSERQQTAGNLEPDKLIVRGAQQHNLKHIDVAIPRYKFVVLTGVSGSGKSSLAFDTIYAEGQRRYVESLSPFVRHFLDKVEKPRVDFIGGLSPAIAIEQKTIARNPRSTVGTVTEVMHYLRLLFSRAGTAHCVQCGSAIAPQSPEEMTRRLSNLPAGVSFHVLAPLVRRRRGAHSEVIEQAGRDGHTHARIDGASIVALAGLRLAEEQRHTIEVLVESFQVPTEPGVFWRERLASALRTALRLGAGMLVVALDDGQDVTLSEQPVCASCGALFPVLNAQHFSPNSPLGMCTRCNGLGALLEVDPALIIENPALSLLDGASRWYGNVRKRGQGWQLDQLRSLAAHYGADLDLPWQDLPRPFRDMILYGSGDEKIRIIHRRGSEERTWSGESVQVVQGIVYHINRLFRQTRSDATRRWYSSFMSQQPCPACQGTRLSAEVRAVTLGGKTIHEVGGLTLAGVLDWLDGLYDSLDDEAFAIAEEVLKEARQRIQFMLNVGLHYLTLDRPAPSLSGGEGQRIRLASQLGCGLVGVLYVLDEPSIGLHARDQRTLLETLLQLRDMGNTVLVVEHDAETMRSADWLIDLGPGAGVLGGEIVAAGTPENVAAHPNSLTGRYLSGELRVSAPTNRRRTAGADWITIGGATLHNLKDVEAHFPPGLLTCVTGVSGSGKSSLVNGTLYPALLRALHNSRETPGPYTRLEGLEQLDKVINITQDPIGRTPRSNPATYAGIFDAIRAIFAASALARERGYKADRFSFNVPGGRCENCKGHGQKVVEMHFLADVWVPCKECKGTRFNRETLEVRYRGKTIAEVLDMDVQEALAFFADQPKLARVLRTLHEVGLDYIKLGQSATTFSGGEAQRIKLAKELSRTASGRTLYILDEPTTGLHFADIQRLLDVLHRLVDAGNTVIVIEHNLDVIKTADWLIDLGPDGGAVGGSIVAQGTPEMVAQVETSATGHFLRDVLL